MSTFGEVHSNPETTLRPGNDKVKNTPTTATWQWKQQSHVNTYLTDLLRCASAVLSNRAKTTSSEGTNLDANQGKLIRITVVSINFSEWILKMPIKNNIYGNTPWDWVCHRVKACTHSRVAWERSRGLMCLGSSGIIIIHRAKIEPLCIC